MSAHTDMQGGTDRSRRGVAILVGNPNVGKSQIFRNLTSRHVNVSNFPGTTVEVVRARARFDGRELDVIDTPGLNDLAPRGDESRVTRELLAEHPDATIVQIADARNLRRALFLTLQLAELERPMVLVLNMFDELEERGGRIDSGRLSEILGVPVVESVAPRNRGTRELIASLARARVPRPAAGGKPQAPGATGAGDRAAATERPPERPAVPDAHPGRRLLERANRILAETYSIREPAEAPLRIRLGFWAMHPLKGLGFLGVILLAVFWVVGLFGAGTLVDLLEIAGFQQRVSPAVIRLVDRAAPFPHEHEVAVVPYALSLPVSPAHDVTIARADRQAILPSYAMPPGRLSPVQRVARFAHDFVVGPFGLVTMALSYAIAIVLPIVTIFFLVFSVLEDSGYFPRMAIMVNRVFRAMGLNGKAVLPMILGLGCTTMATMATRILETRKERLVTTVLLALAIPCSAQLGVLLALMAALSPVGALLWLGVMAGVILLVGGLTARVFPGPTSEFIVEIPPMRKPQISNVLTKTASRLNWYLREVIPVFVVGTAVLFLADRLGMLDWLSNAGAPLVTGWLGLPREMSNALLVGFMRRDFGAVYILDAATGPSAVLSPHQILIAMVTITLFMPCFANLLMIAREHGKAVAAGMVAFIFPFAFLVGGLLHRILG
ncbi:MAG: FeoB small GTPase domain-containing protein [Gemmatimonadota bacterium]